MAFNKHADQNAIGTGNRGISTAWKLAERSLERSENNDENLAVRQKTGITSGAYRFARGGFRSNDLQPATPGNWIANRKLQLISNSPQSMGLN